MALLLIIDDRAGRAHSLAMVLQQTGHQAHIADSSAAALALLPDLTPALILLSDDLPPHPQGPFCRRLKAHCQHIPVLLYSDELRLSNAAYVQALGADYTLPYPLTRHNLIQQVTAALKPSLSSEKQVG